MTTTTTYRDKQRQFYRIALGLGHLDTALDALWRAASEADLLTTAERSHTDLTTARILTLLDSLGWERCKDSWADQGLGI